jgi:ABC-type sugar transport system ATPase subunit
MLGERSDASTASENSRHAKVNDAPRPTALVVRNWRVLKSEVSRVEVGPLDFEARRGEILGVFGPLGAGKTELLHSLYGLAGGLCSGEHWLDGAPMQPFATPVAAIQRGMALVSAERQREGIVPGLSVLENMMLGYRRPGLTRQGMMIRHSEARTLCERLIATLGIMTNGPDQPIESLSGGNQQKVLLARAMVNSPTILLLDEPTRGIDVGAKQDVYRWIRDTATAGAVVVVSSLEEEELIGLADRILVLRDGQKVALLDATRTSAKELLILTAGGPPH